MMKSNPLEAEPYGTPTQAKLAECIAPLNAVDDLTRIFPPALIKLLEDKRCDSRGLRWGINNQYNNKVSNNPRNLWIDEIVEETLAGFACAGVALKIDRGRHVDRATFSILCKQAGNPDRSHQAGGACGSRKATSLTGCGWKISFTTIWKTATHIDTGTKASIGGTRGRKACHIISLKCAFVFRVVQMFISPTKYSALKRFKTL